jgi:hypothetical protein
MKNATITALILAVGIGLGIFTSAVLASSPVDAKPSPIHVEKYVTSGKLAIAQWASEDDQTYTQGYVNLIDIAKDSSGNLVSFVDVVIQQYRLVEHCQLINGEQYCNYDYEDLLGFYGSAELDKSDFTISNNVRTASLENVEITGIDYYSGKEMTITVDGTWTDSGGPIKIKRTYSESNEYYKLFFKGMFKGTEAEASIKISGDIDASSSDGSDYSEAFIAKAKNSALYKINDAPI